MFEIPVWDLLASYSWDSKELEFKWDVPPWFFDEFEFIRPLEMKLKIIWLDDWVDVVIEKIWTWVKFDWQVKFVNTWDIERRFKQTKDINDPDDIRYINMHWATIDMKEVIKEEILIQIMD